MSFLRVRSVAVALSVVGLLSFPSALKGAEVGPFNGVFKAEGAFGLHKELPDSAPVKAGASWTMNLWLRPDAALGDKTLIAGFGNGHGRGAQRYFANFADGLRFWGDFVDIPLHVTAEPGRWHMLTAVHDQGTLTLYYDGKQVASQTVELTDAAREVNLGTQAPWPEGTHFGGKIAQFTIVDRALSATEVQALGRQGGGLDALTYEKGAPQTWGIQHGGGQSGNPNQNPESFPKSTATPARPVKAPRVARPTFERDRDGGLILRGGWKLIEAPKVKTDGAALSQAGASVGAGWYEATVPGTVLTTLVNEGVYPDPLYGLNNLAIPESLNKQDYWYRLEFTPPKELAGRHLEIVFNGINYAAEAWLNGKRLGEIKGAFIRGRFDVSGLVQPGQANALAVRVSPPPHPGIPHEQSIAAGAGPNGGAMCLDGPTFFCTEGWDWIPGIRDRDTGLWQDVVLQASGPVMLGDPQVITRVPEPVGSRADVTIAVELKNTTAAEQRGKVKGAFEGVAFAKDVVLPAGQTQTIRFAPSEFPQLAVAKPRLWWPNGYGRPELYHLALSYEDAAGQESDRKTLSFGMREVSVLLSALAPDEKVGRYEFTPAAAGEQEVIKHDHASLVSTPEGWTPSIAPESVNSPALKASDEVSTAPFLVVKVNGQKIVLRGGNWGMDDALKRVSRERLEPYFRLQRDSNFNLIRNWCGQSTEEALYQLADEYGLLIWNEFWLTTQGNNQEPAAAEPLLSNAQDTIKRFRNHPSIILWCGRNEGVPPPAINEGLDALIRKYDGTRYYQPSSTVFNLRGSGPWSYLEPAEYFSRTGFTTELGLPSPLTADGIRAMMPAADLWPANDDWAYHDWVPSGAMNVTKFMAALESRYGKPVDLDDFDRKAQMVNYVSHRAMFEGINPSLWKPTSGRLIWMSHPSWPSFVWQIYGHDYEPNAAFYGIKKACEPRHVQMNPDGSVLVVNTTPAPLPAVKVTAKVFAIDGKQVSAQDATLDVGANTTVPGTKIDAEAAGTVRFIVLELRDARGTLLSENFYWNAKKPEDYLALNSLPAVKLGARAAVRKLPEKTVVYLELTNPGKAVALMAHATLRDAATGRRILPAYASDNYLNFLPGQRRVVTFECAAGVSAPLAITLSGWNVTPQVVRPEGP